MYACMRPFELFLVLDGCTRRVKCVFSVITAAVQCSRPPSEVAEISGERAKHSNQGGFFLSNTTSSTSEESVANSSYHRTVLKETDASKALRVDIQKAIGVPYKGRRDQHRGTSGQQSPRQPTGEEPAPVSIRPSVHRPSTTSKAMLDGIESGEEGRPRRQIPHVSGPSPVKFRLQGGAAKSSTIGMDPASSLPPPTRRKKEQVSSSKGFSEGEKSPGIGTTPPGDTGSSEQRNLKSGRSGTRGKENPQLHDHVRGIESAPPAKLIPRQTPHPLSTGTSGNGKGQSARQSPHQIDHGHGIHDKNSQTDRPRDVKPTPNQQSDERPSSRRIPSSSGIAAINTIQHEEDKIIDRRRTQPGPSEPDQPAIGPSQSEAMGPGSRGPGQPPKDDGSSKRPKSRQNPMCDSFYVFPTLFGT